MRFSWLLAIQVIGGSLLGVAIIIMLAFLLNSLMEWYGRVIGTKREVPFLAMCAFLVLLILFLLVGFLTPLV